MNIAAGMAYAGAERKHKKEKKHSKHKHKHKKVGSRSLHAQGVCSNSVPHKAAVADHLVAALMCMQTAHVPAVLHVVDI
jgi:hypothetical protein